MRTLQSRISMSFDNAAISLCQTDAKTLDPIAPAKYAIQVVGNTPKQQLPQSNAQEARQ